MLFWLPKAQLWRLKVASQEDSDSWSQERTDEGEVDEARPRQLEGIDVMRSQTGGSDMITKDYWSLSFRYEGFFCLEALTEQRLRVRWKWKDWLR